MRKVLVTGMSGLIGQAVRKQLEGKVELSALNRSEVRGVRWFEGDIADFASIQPAFAGQDTVVHLAAVARVDASFDALLQANIIGTYHVFEAAKQAGVKRVVYASSGATISGWQREEPYKALSEGRYDDAGEWPMITHLSPFRPAGIYGATKLWGEALARHYTDTSPLSILCLRIGVVNKEDRPLTTGHIPIWCSQRDVAQMVERCIFAPDGLRFDTFFVTSRNRWGYRDLSHAREVVGYEPQDSADDFQ